MKGRTAHITQAVGLLLGLIATAASWAQPPVKKLIEYGWDVPKPTYVAAHIREMEERPFEGLIMRVPYIGQVFDTSPMDEERVAQEMDALARIEWGKFTDNFIIMYAASTMDWFSDADWEIVLQKVRQCARAARIGRCKGVCFDYEPYGKNPWQYSEQAHAAEKSFEEYYEQVRKRGAQFMQALESEYPGLVMHTFFQLSYFPHIARDPDEVSRMNRLSREYYGLLPAFINGLLDAAGPDVILTDGNENAYYYTDSLSYFAAFHNIRQTALGLVAPENRRKYLSQMQCAQALYVDYVFKYWPYPTPATFMTDEERARWFEHNVYWALTTSDQYVWLYSEKMNWWTNENLPPGLVEAVVSAKRKLANGEGLGYDLVSIIREARQREAEELRKKLGDKTARVRRLGAGEAPVVDGVLDDAAWQQVSALEAFMPYAREADDSLKAQTLAWIAYDDDNLYIAVRCEEPNMEGLNIVGDRRDENIWVGDSVDVFIATGSTSFPFYHIILNANNVRWDARHVSETVLDGAWNPDYQSATRKESDHWSLELAIPWSVLGLEGAPAGAQLSANICRARSAGDQREYSSWSRCISGFVEPERFGVWVFD